MVVAGMALLVVAAIIFIALNLLPALEMRGWRVFRVFRSTFQAVQFILYASAVAFILTIAGVSFLILHAFGPWIMVGCWLVLWLILRRFK